MKTLESKKKGKQNKIKDVMECFVCDFHHEK